MICAISCTIIPLCSRFSAIIFFYFLKAREQGSKAAGSKRENFAVRFSLFLCLLSPTRTAPCPALPCLCTWSASEPYLCRLKFLLLVPLSFLLLALPSPILQYLLGKRNILSYSADNTEPDVSKLLWFPVIAGFWIAIVMFHRRFYICNVSICPLTQYCQWLH